MRTRDLIAAAVAILPLLAPRPALAQDRPRDDIPSPTTTEERVLRGLGDFVLRRAEAEVQASVLAHLKVSLCTEHSRPWLRQTCALLDGDADQPNQFVGGARINLTQSLRADVRAAPWHLMTYFADALGPASASVRTIAEWIHDGAVPSVAAVGAAPPAAINALRTALAGSDAGATTTAATTLLTQAGPAGNAEQVHALTELLGALAHNDLARTLSATTQLARLGPGDSHLSGVTLRALALGVALHEAADEEQAAAAFEAFAAPAGSWRARTERTVVGLSAWVGVSSGFEFFAAHEWAPTMAPSLSVGFDVSVHVERWALGVFIPVIDLGGLVRFNTATPGIALNNLSAEPVRLTSILNPGLLFRISPPIPLVLGAGVIVHPHYDSAMGPETGRIAAQAVVTLAVPLDLVQF